MVNLATNLFIAYIIYMVRTYIILLSSKKSRSEHRRVRERLAQLRSKTNLSVAEQREFINLKNPKTKPFKWSVKKVARILFNVALMVVVFLIVRGFWDAKIPVLLKLWQVIPLMVVLPMVANALLKKFGLEQDDLRVFWKRRG